MISLLLKMASNIAQNGYAPCFTLLPKNIWLAASPFCIGLLLITLFYWSSIKCLWNQTLVSNFTNQTASLEKATKHFQSKLTIAIQQYLPLCLSFLWSVAQYGTLANRYETDSPLWVLLRASAKIMATSMHLILSHWIMCSSWGMVFVATTASKQAPLIRAMAGPEKIPWVRIA